MQRINNRHIDGQGEKQEDIKTDKKMTGIKSYVYFAAKLLANKTYELRNVYDMLDITKCPVATLMKGELRM